MVIAGINVFFQSLDHTKHQKCKRIFQHDYDEIKKCMNRDGYSLF